MRTSGNNREGSVLVAVVLLMVMAAVAALSVTVFLTERVSLLEARARSEKALYLAQAGIHGAVFSYRLRDQSGNGFFPLGLYQMDAGNGFVLSGQESDLLMVDASSATIGGGDACDDELADCEDQCDEIWDECYASCDQAYTACVAACPSKGGQACRRACQRQRDRNCYPVCDVNRAPCYSQCQVDYQSCMVGAGTDRDLTGITFQNATNSQTLTIQRMVISWDNNRRLSRVVVDGQTRWSGNTRSPVTVYLSPVVVVSGPSAPLTHAVNSLSFNNSMSAVGHVTIDFVMGDGSVRTARVYPASRDHFYFTVTSEGRETGPPVSRTVQAVYYAGPVNARIADYREID